MGVELSAEGCPVLGGEQFELQFGAASGFAAFLPLHAYRSDFYGLIYKKVTI